MAGTQSAYGKPLPLMRGYTKEFYDFCKNRELRFNAVQTAAPGGIRRGRCAAIANRSKASG